MIQKLIRTEMNTREGLCPPRLAAWRAQTVWCASEVSRNSLLEEALTSALHGFGNTGGWEARPPRHTPFTASRSKAAPTPGGAC